MASARDREAAKGRYAGAGCRRPLLRFHPDLVAERLVRYANLVGRENVLAGTDCGLTTKLHLAIDARGREAAEVMRGLIEEIRLVPMNNKLEIYLIGNLAAILDLCAKKNPSSVGAGVQVTLVAEHATRFTEIDED